MYTITPTTTKTSSLFNSPHQIHIFTPKIPKLNIPKTSLKPLTLSNSEQIPFQFDGFKKTQYPLPIAIQNSGGVSRFFWDGNEVKLESFHDNDFDFSDFGVRKLARICWGAGRDFFLPRVFSANYLEYVKWKMLHRVFSSALQVLATQAMFRAIGIGYLHSLPSAAALNWVLKDGLGRLSRCIYTASLASAFDTNLKRVRFTTSVMFSLSIGVELLTPIFPHYFLLLASIANIAKQISLACYLATGTAVHRSFAIADNVGEVSAKAQIQTVCFDNLGLVLAASLNILCQNNQRLLAGLPFLVYPIFSAADLYGIYQGLKHVHLQTVTKDRLEIIISIWIQDGYVPSPAEVSEIEGVDFLSNKGREPWSIRVGCLDPGSQILKASMLTIHSLNKDDFYFICVENLTHRSRTSGQVWNSQSGILLCVREGASSLDILLGLLQACYFRKGLIVNWPRWEDSLQACDSSDAAVIREWFELMEASKKSAEGNMVPLKEQMYTLGWSFKNILLSAKEQLRYSFIPECS